MIPYISVRHAATIFVIAAAVIACLCMIEVQ